MLWEWIKPNRIKATNWAADQPSESLVSDPFHDNGNKLQLVSLLIIIYEIKVNEFLDLTAVLNKCYYLFWYKGQYVRFIYQSYI